MCFVDCCVDRYASEVFHACSGRLRHESGQRSNPLIRFFVPLQLLIQFWWRQCVAIVGDLSNGMSLVKADLEMLCAWCRIT